MSPVISGPVTLLKAAKAWLLTTDALARFVICLQLSLGTLLSRHPPHHKTGSRSVAGFLPPVGSASLAPHVFNAQGSCGRGCQKSDTPQNGLPHGKHRPNPVQFLAKQNIDMRRALRPAAARRLAARSTSSQENPLQSPWVGFSRCVLKSRMRFELFTLEWPIQFIPLSQTTV